MNLYTIIGAAAVDSAFLALLLRDRVAAARALGLFLTVGELAALDKLLANEDAVENLQQLSSGVCPRPPCPPCLAPVFLPPPSSDGKSAE